MKGKRGEWRGNHPLSGLSNGYLLPPDLEELISANYVARVVKKAVDLLDIRELTSQ